MLLLLVEDERDLLESTAAFLRKKGFSVFPAAGGEDVWKLPRSEKAAYDAAFIDVFLGSESGLEIADEMKYRNPGIKILVTSGSLKKTRLTERIIISRYAFLPKPYDRKKLLAALGKL